MRAPIIDQLAPRYTYGVAHNPFGDDPQCEGYYIHVHDHVQGTLELLPLWFATHEEAHAAMLREMGL